MKMSVLMLDKDQSFAMQANVISPGYQSIVLRGYITERRPDGTYVAPLLPQLFFGADGSQLTTWRQYISGTGAQTILSRSAGSPMVPREELFWKKISDFKREPAKVEVAPLEIPLQLTKAILAFIGGTVLIILSRRR
ncbi:hypothetical protein LCGC14_0815850 [marine sediment metagenome]|uniref:Uncharacterized protein n=1 Tax=marine sediment metagenome TaxID=412755 RepID=A0A0F9PK79_9ZZZZ